MPGKASNVCQGRASTRSKGLGGSRPRPWTRARCQQKKRSHMDSVWQQQSQQVIDWRELRHTWPSQQRPARSTIGLHGSFMTLPTLQDGGSRQPYPIVSQSGSKSVLYAQCFTDHTSLCFTNQASRCMPMFQCVQFVSFICLFNLFLIFITVCCQKIFCSNITDSTDSIYQGILTLSEDIYQLQTC